MIFFLLPFLICDFDFWRGENCFLLTTCPDIINNTKNNLTYQREDQNESKYNCLLETNNQNELVSFNCLDSFLNLFITPFMFKYYYETNQ